MSQNSEHNMLSSSRTDVFVGWLKRNNLPYQRELAEEGYDDLESFSMIPEDEIDELCRTVKMKTGHRRKMPALVARAKDEVKREREREQRRIDIEESRLRKRGEGAEKTQDDDRISANDTTTNPRQELPRGKRLVLYFR